MLMAHPCSSDLGTIARVVSSSRAFHANQSHMAYMHPYHQSWTVDALDIECLHVPRHMIWPAHDIL